MHSTNHMYRTRTWVESRSGISSLTRSLILLGFVVVILIMIGCAPGDQRSGNGSANVNTNAVSSGSNSNSEASGEATARIPITLPVVDALLADEGFVTEFRRSIQPTDEQFDKLKNVSRDAVLKLGEDISEDSGRSTRASRNEAEKQIRQVLGNDAGDRFIALAQKYWAGGDLRLAARPNEVPTDTRVVINAPAYRMDIFQDGKLTKSYKIGIGYPEFPLPVGIRTAKTIIFNPTWTPPDEPWVKGEFRPGKTVEPGSAKNPLGVLKIPIGLPSLIHGGKDPGRLGTFASHGCVGLTDPLAQDFAMQLSAISGAPLETEQVKEYARNRKEMREIDLSKQITVELRYETIVAEDGKLHVFRDVYEHGTNTEENLGRVLSAHGISMNDLSPDEQAKVREALEEMAVDAQGKPVADDEKRDDKPSTSSRVTRNIKGKKEIVIPIAALKGKGYPAPVEING